MDQLFSHSYELNPLGERDKASSRFIAAQQLFEVLEEMMNLMLDAVEEKQISEAEFYDQVIRICIDRLHTHFEGVVIMEQAKILILAFGKKIPENFVSQFTEIYTKSVFGKIKAMRRHNK